MMNNDDYMKTMNYGFLLSKMYGDNPIHNQHIDEFRELAAVMIDQALKEHD